MLTQVVVVRNDTNVILSSRSLPAVTKEEGVCVNRTAVTSKTYE